MAAVRRRVRRLLVTEAAARLATAMLAAGVVLGTADYLVRFEDRGIRFMSSLALAAVAGWMFYRSVWPALKARLGDAELAWQLERRLPILADRLASALRFLRQREDDELAGSAALRRTVIMQATAEVERVDLQAAIDPRAARRSLWLAGVPLGLLLIAVVLHPSAARIAFLRLVAPWGDTQWPRQNYLEFDHPPTRLVAGQTFEVELKDARGERLPDEVFIQYRFADAAPGVETSERMRHVNDAVVARKEQVTRPFSYRAVGGDDYAMWSNRR